MIANCRARGMRAIVGQVVSENPRMRELARTLGFRQRLIPGEGVVEVTLDLQS